MFGCHHFHCKRASHDLVLLARMQRERALKKEEKKKKKRQRKHGGTKSRYRENEGVRRGFPRFATCFRFIPTLAAPFHSHFFFTGLTSQFTVLAFLPRERKLFFFFTSLIIVVSLLFFLVRGPMNQKHRAKTKKKKCGKEKGRKNSKGWGDSIGKKKKNKDNQSKQVTERSEEEKEKEK